MDEAKVLLDQKLTLQRELDQTLEDLNNVDQAFADVIKKLDRSKATLIDQKDAERSLLAKDEDMDNRVVEMDDIARQQKAWIQDRVKTFYEDYKGKVDELAGDNSKLKVQHRLTEMRGDSLRRDLNQKLQENFKLRQLCDEILAIQNLR